MKNREKMIRKEKIDILHGSMIHGGGAMALEMKKKIGIPIVVQSHGSDVQIVPEIGYGACLNTAGEKIVRNVIVNADHIVALSDFNKKLIVELGGQEDKISIIHNGILYNEIQEVPFISLRSEYNIDHEDFVLICVGRNRPVKRMELLFKALSLLGDNTPYIKFICVGPENNLYELVKKYKLHNCVILAGKKPDKITESTNFPFPELINLYRSSDLYVSTSFVESFGNAAADALACGIPILIGKNHGIRDIIRERETGWVMEEETPEELAEMILEISKQKEELAMKKKEISESVKHLTWENIAIELCNIYRKLCEHRV